MTTFSFFDTMKHMKRRSHIVALGMFVCFGFITFALLAPSAHAVTSTAATSSGFGGELYTPRYLPSSIVQGAQGPGDLVFLVYKYLMGLVGIVAVGVIMYGGVLRTVSASSTKIQQADAYIKNAIKGIVLLFGAQVIFNTINPNIINIDRIQKAIQPKEKITPPAAFTGVEITPMTDEEAAEGAQEWGDESLLERGRFGGNVISETNAVERIRAIGGGVVVKGCDAGLTESCMCTGEQRAAGKKADGSGCVSFLGAKDKTMKEIVGLGKSVGSGVVITSVTDGHGVAGLTGSAHNTGDKFDIRPLPTVSNYIRANFKRLPLGTDWMDPNPRTPKLERYQNPTTGAIYVLETARGSRAAHWDVDTRPNAPAAEEG